MRSLSPRRSSPSLRLRSRPSSSSTGQQPESLSITQVKDGLYYPDRRRPVRDVPDDHRGRRADDTRHVVVRGNPEAAVPPSLRVLRQVQAVAQGERGVAPFRDRRQIEDGKSGHLPLTERPEITFPSAMIGPELCPTGVTS